MNAKLAHTIKTAEAELAEMMADLGDTTLALFVIDCDRGRPLEGYCRGVTVDRLLRTLGGVTIYRELMRRQEVAELEAGE